MIYFFFYNNLLTDSLIHKISNNVFIQPGTVYIETFNKANNKLFIGNKSTLLDGKLIAFTSDSLPTILDKIKSIPEIKYTHRTNYILNEIDVKTSNRLVKAYVIY